MKLDLFNHFFPAEYYKALLDRPLNDPALMERIVNIRALSDLDLRLEQVESIGPDYAQVLSLPGPAVDLADPPERAAQLARLANEGLADLVRRYPRHFPAFAATVPMVCPDRMVPEAEYAVRTLGARAIQIFTNVAGKPLDLPEYEPLWSLMEELDLPILLHPARTSAFADYPSELDSRLGLWMTLGWPYETSAAMVRLVYSGVLERHPRLKIVVHHAGAMIPMFWQRANSTARGLSGLTKTPAEYLKQFYADTALFGNLAGTRCGLEFFGAEHMVFASDAPFGPPPGTAFITSAIQVIDSLELTDAQRQAIYAQNARTLLRL